MLNPHAALDCLCVIERLQREDNGASTAELHLFPYLACLLWLYRRQVVADWGYQFVGTELGAPFSVEIDAAVQELLRRGCLVRIQGRLHISEDADEILQTFSSLELNHGRVECLNAACASTVALSPGIVGSALAQEPDLQRARAVPLSRPLLEEPAQSRLYEQFSTLRKGLESDSPDLRVPAVVWLTALYRSGEA
jgi:hypothetical protein